MPHFPRSGPTPPRAPDLWSVVASPWFGTADISGPVRSVTDMEAVAAVDAAWDAGVRGFFASAHLDRGLGERRLGAALRTRPRGEFVLAAALGRSEPGFSTAGVRGSLATSLERLGSDRLDVALLHDVPERDRAVEIAVGVSALTRLRDEGAVGAVGVTSASVAVLEAARATGVVDVLVVEGRYTLLEQSAAALVCRCAEDRVAVVVADALHAGLLGEPNPMPSRTPEEDGFPPHLVDRARALALLCDRGGTSLPEAALAFPLRAPAVRAVIVGGRNPSQVRENVCRSRADVPDSVWDALRLGSVS